MSPTATPRGKRASGSPLSVLVRDRTLELVLADAEALRDVPEEVRGRIG
jgi:hypothetical protein